MQRRRRRSRSTSPILPLFSSLAPPSLPQTRPRPYPEMPQKNHHERTTFQVPLRRSPRFLAPENDGDTLEPPSSTTPKKSSKSLSDSRGTGGLEKTRGEYSEKGQTEDSKPQESEMGRSGKTRCRNVTSGSEKRRSPRFPIPVWGSDLTRKGDSADDFRRRSARLTGSSKKGTVKVEVGVSKQIEMKKKKVIPPISMSKVGDESERTKIEVRDGSTKCPDIVEVGGSNLCDNRMSNVEKVKEKKKDSSLVLSLKEGREKKKRKAERTDERIAVEGRVGEECFNSNGWTDEQEIALRNAYLIARPSPHFWKKVSKMVPGKSAQECFDRVHSNHVTPPQVEPRSRARKMDFSPLSHLTLSGSKPGDSLKTSFKRPKSNKQKTLLAHKTVRHILKKHRLVDQEQEADLFTVLETSPGLSALDFSQIKAPSTPKFAWNSPASLQKSNEMPLTHKKTHSRFKDPIKVDLVSPEVLKRVKNIALHEKYIDQLHCREAKRRMRVLSSCVGANQVNGLQKTVVKAAKNALISDARVVISQFQHTQAATLTDGEDTDDNGSAEDEEEAL